MSNSISGEEGLKFRTLVHCPSYFLLSCLKCDIQQKEGSAETLGTKRLFHTCSRTCSQCSIKGGNLRELTRWLEPTGKAPVGTFLSVYDLLHAHIR